MKKLISISVFFLLTFLAFLSPTFGQSDTVCHATLQLVSHAGKENAERAVHSTPEKTNFYGIEHMVYGYYSNILKERGFDKAKHLFEQNMFGDSLKRKIKTFQEVKDSIELKSVSLNYFEDSLKFEKNCYYVKAKQRFDSLLGFNNKILSYFSNGLGPDSVENMRIIQLQRDYMATLGKMSKERFGTERLCVDIFSKDMYASLVVIDSLFKKLPNEDSVNQREVVKKIILYYERYNSIRDKNFAKFLAQKWEEGYSPALAVGAYHGPGITRALKELGIPFIVIDMFNYNEDTEYERYIQKMMSFSYQDYQTQGEIIDFFLLNWGTGITK